MRSSLFLFRAGDFFTASGRGRWHAAADALSLTIYGSQQMKSIFSPPGLACDGIAPGQLAPARLASLTYRNRVDQIDAPRNLPTTQPCPAMRKQFSLAYPIRNDASGHFLVPPFRFTPENNGFSHPLISHDFGFDFRGMHLFPGDVNQIRASSND